MNVPRLALGLTIAGGGAFIYRSMDRKLRAFPPAPEPLALADAFARADRGGLPWVALSGLRLDCGHIQSSRRYYYVPVAESPALLIDYKRYKFSCDAAPRDAVGTLERAPASVAKRLLGDDKRPLYRLYTWDDPENARAGRLVGIVFMLIGLALVLRSWTRRPGSHMPSGGF